MRLKLLREHYRRSGRTWVPKQSFKTEAEIKEKTGFDANKCNVYTCGFCNLLHLTSYETLTKRKELAEHDA